MWSQRSIFAKLRVIGGLRTKKIPTGIFRKTNGMVMRKTPGKWNLYCMNFWQVDGTVHEFYRFELKGKPLLKFSLLNRQKDIEPSTGVHRDRQTWVLCRFLSPPPWFLEAIKSKAKFTLHVAGEPAVEFYQRSDGSVGYELINHIRWVKVLEQITPMTDSKDKN